MEKTFLLEAILKPYNISLARQKELAAVLDLPDNSQKDLMFMSAILVSTGTNKNGATFLGSELIKARNSISQKPLDKEHVESEIIGHIVSSIYMDFNGNIIEDEKLLDELGKATAKKEDLRKLISKLDSMQMDIGIVCALYKDRFPQLAEEVGKGEWKVSMECYYKDYDLKIGSLILPKLTCNSIFSTDPKVSAEIDKVTMGDTLGTDLVSRVLRDIAFCGVGIVKNPANERSIVLEAANVEEAENISFSEAAKEKTNEEVISLQIPTKGYGIAIDNKEIVYFSDSDSLEDVIKKAAEMSLGSGKDHTIISNLSTMKNQSLDPNIITTTDNKTKVIYYKVDSNGNIYRVLPEDTQKVLEEKEINMESKNTKEEALLPPSALPEKEGISVPENPEAITEVTLSTPNELNLALFADVPLHEILDILWLQVYNVRDPENKVLTPSTPVQYSDPIDNRRLEQSYALPKQKLFFIDSAKSLEDSMKVFSYVIDKLTQEEKEEFFVNLIKASISYNVDTNKFEEYMRSKGVSMGQIVEYSAEFAIPRLKLLPLTSREQVIAAMSRCLHVKEKLTDKEKEYMIVNILRAAKTHNIDCSGFKERVKKVNF